MVAILIYLNEYKVAILVDYRIMFYLVHFCLPNIPVYPMLVDTKGTEDSSSFAISLSTKRLIAHDITAAMLIYLDKYMAPFWRGVSTTE